VKYLYCVGPILVHYVSHPSTDSFGDKLISSPFAQVAGPLSPLVVLLSAEIVALSHLLIIIYISVCLTLRWLPAETPELAEHSWGPVSMGLALHVFKDKLEEVIAKPRLVICESCIMNMFVKILADLTPVQKGQG